MEDYQLDLIIGEGQRRARSRSNCQSHAVVRRRGRLLTDALRDRFGIPIRLEFYDVQELEQIVKRGARALASGGALPRTAPTRSPSARAGRAHRRRLLKRVRDFALVDGAPASPRGCRQRLALSRRRSDRARSDGPQIPLTIATSFGAGRSASRPSRRRVCRSRATHRGDPSSPPDSAWLRAAHPARPRAHPPRLPHLGLPEPKSDAVTGRAVPGRCRR